MNWISILDGLPEDDSIPYVVWLREGRWVAAFLFDREWWSPAGDDDYTTEVTHWMGIDPPKEK